MTQGGIFHRPFERRHEPGILTLEEEVVGACLQRLHRLLLADHPGDDDEGEVQPALLDEAQSVEAGKGRQAVVGKDRVPGAVLQRCPQFRSRLDPHIVGIDPPLLQFQHRQQGVVFHVLDEQEPQRLRHNPSRLRNVAANL